MFEKCKVCGKDMLENSDDSVCLRTNYWLCLEHYILIASTIISNNNAWPEFYRKVEQLASSQTNL